MTLHHYLSSERGSATKLAAYLGVSISYISQMASRTAPISPHRAVAIEKFTNGAVTRADLRPHDFWLIWPDLEQQVHFATEKC